MGIDLNPAIKSVEGMAHGLIERLPYLVLGVIVFGIFFLITEPFRIGDQITVSGMAGTVENIETRATLLRTYDSRRIVIPNATLFTQSVVVDTAYPKRRLEHDIQLADVDDPHDLERHMVSALKAVDGVQKEPPPEVYVLEVAPDTLTLRCRWWVTPTRGDDALRSQDQAMRAIRDCLAASARSEKQAAA